MQNSFMLTVCIMMPYTQRLLVIVEDPRRLANGVHAVKIVGKPLGQLSEVLACMTS